MNRRAAQRKREAQRRQRIGLVVGALVLVVIVAVVLVVVASRGSEDAAVPPDGERIYATNCASCHGDRAEGLFRFPRLAGVVSEKYPNPDDQAAVVRSGRGEMPAFADKLSPEEIRAVVEFTRALR